MGEPLSKDEFMAHVGYIREDIAGVHARLDALNGRTRELETTTARHAWAIAVIGACSMAIFAWVLAKL